MLQQQVYKVTSQYLYFCTCNGQKMWWRYLYETPFLAFLIAVSQKKWHFFGILKRNWTRYARFFKENFEFQNLTFNDLNLTWTFLLPQMTRKTCVPRYSCYICIWWPHSAWPWPMLSISLLLAWHIRHFFSSTLAEFGLTAGSGLVSPADKADKSQLWHLTWPWLDI